MLFLVPAISQTHKTLENSQDFFCQDQDQDFYLKTKTKTLGLKTKTFIFVLEAPRDQDFGLEDYITGLVTGRTSNLSPNNPQMKTSGLWPNWSTGCDNRLIKQNEQKVF